MSAHLELTLGHWRARRRGRDADESTQVGAAAVLRHALPNVPQWFVDASLGLNAVAPVFRRGEEEFTTVFNFSEHLGVGFRPAGSGWDWSLRYQHVSNGGIREPNPGQNVLQLRLSRLL